MDLPRFSNEIVLNVIKCLCDDILKDITKYFYHYYRITYHQHPKKICNKLRLVNKWFSRLFENEFLIQINKRDDNIHLSDYQILLNLNKLSYSNANNYKNCMDLFKAIGEKPLNFWKKIILN